MSDDILIVGARGLGKEILGYLRDDERYNPVAFLDELDAGEVLGLPVVHPDAYDGGCRRAVFAVGYPWTRRLPWPSTRPSAWTGRLTSTRGPSYPLTRPWGGASWSPPSPRSAVTPHSATSSSSTSMPRWDTTPVSATAAP
ncbi:hypothetical protein H8E07_03825 [bacterium]|nr:hypothetical protein [bacterium]